MNDEAMRWGHRFYMKSGFLPDLPDELLDLLVEHMARVPDGTDGEVSFWAMGRAISEVPEDATAFTGRDAAFWIAAEILWHDEELDEQCREWTRALMDDVLPFTSAGPLRQRRLRGGRRPRSFHLRGRQVRAARRAQAGLGPGQRLPPEPERAAVTNGIFTARRKIVTQSSSLANQRLIASTNRVFPGSEGNGSCRIGLTSRAFAR